VGPRFSFLRLWFAPQKVRADPTLMSRDGVSDATQFWRSSGLVTFIPRLRRSMTGAPRRRASRIGTFLTVM